MNLDFKIPLNGKVARRLKFISSIINLDIDDRIFDHLGDDLIDQSVINTTFHQSVSDTQLNIIQFASDCDYRCIIGAIEASDLVLSLLQCAIMSGKKILILDELDDPNHTGITQWHKTMIDMNLSYSTIAVNHTIPTDLSQSILIANSLNDITELLRTERDRILLCTSSSRELPMTMNMMSPIGYSINDLCREFTTVICGFYLNIKGWPITKKWAGERGVEYIINAINCDTKMAKAISYDKVTQMSMMDSGYTVRSPEHIGRLLNVNVELLSS